jgi:hypothetical protein
MKKLLNLLFVCLFICGFFLFGASAQTLVDYQPLVDDPYNCITVMASVNNSKAGDFILDTGTTTGGIKIDSIFFYNEIDTSNLVRVEPKHILNYWQVFYKGDISISIGTHRFRVKEIEVTNMHYYKYEDYYACGIIGAEAFMNKITVVDFDRKRIAFTDSFPIDSSYTAVPLLPSLVLPSATTENQKFIEMTGFTDNKGRKLKGHFLFDTGNSVTGLMMKGSYAKKLFPQGVNRIRIDHLSMGDVHINKVSVERVKEGEFDRFEALAGGDGLLGMAIIKRFNFIADYKKNILYLKPNKWFLLKN